MAVLIRSVANGQETGVPTFYLVDTTAEMPASAQEGDLAYDKQANLLYFWNGSAWTSTGGGGGPPDPHASTHHSGGSDPLALGSIAGTITSAQHGTIASGNLHPEYLTPAEGDAAYAPVSHALAGATHSSDTLANLNSKISDADVPALAGQLGGTAASPDVRGLRETGGPTLLTMGAVTDGQFLQRSGSNIIGAAAGGGGASATTVEKDLGSVPVWYGKFTITDAAIGTSSKVLAWQAPGPYTGKGTALSADEGTLDPIVVTAVIPASGSAVCHWETKGHYAPILNRDGREGARDPDVADVGTTGVPRAGNSGYRVGDVVGMRRVGKVKGNVKFSYVVFA